MATFLDIGLVRHFSVIFTILLVFVIMFALLEKSKILGDNRGLHSLIALCLAILMLFVPGVVQVVNLMAPWFVVFVIFIVFFMMLLMAFGIKWEKVVDYATGGWETPHWFLLVIGLIIFIGAISSVYGGAMLPYSDADSAQVTQADGGEMGTTTDTGDFNRNVGRVLFHPKTIGMVFILIVGSLTLRLLAKK